MEKVWRLTFFQNLMAKNVGSGKSKKIDDAYARSKRYGEQNKAVNIRVLPCSITNSRSNEVYKCYGHVLVRTHNK